MKALQVDRRELVEEGEDWDTVHDRGFEEESFALLRGQVAEVAVGVDDGAFVGGDGVGSVLECGADVGYGGFAVFHVQRGGFEEDVSVRGGEPFADVLGSGLAGAKIRVRIQAICVGDPAHAS